MKIHLDLVGGLSGDMFIAAMLDCFPHLTESLPGTIDAGGFRELVSLEMEPHSDGTLTGTRFSVLPESDAEGHHHRHYTEIVQIIERSALTDEVKARALDIFEYLAEAEAKVHGIDMSRVAFHEVGAWDSIADVICAAYLVETVGPASWTVSSIPLGRGRVKTAHGLLPVPAPATTLLLEGYHCHDDGIEGERVTPTGAAILKHLSPSQDRQLSVGTLIRSGHGFGTKVFDGIPNIVRALVFEEVEQASWGQDRVIALAFEIDDQTPEELSHALDRLREHEGVLDVTQTTLVGKKGRQMISVRVLTSAGTEKQVINACFTETTTLGIRREQLERAILRREHRTVDFAGESWRVKIAYRPGGIVTAKLEQDEEARLEGSYRERVGMRRAIETEAVRQVTDES